MVGFVVRWQTPHVVQFFHVALVTGGRSSVETYGAIDGYTRWILHGQAAVLRARRRRWRFQVADKVDVKVTVPALAERTRSAGTPADQ